MTSTLILVAALAALVATVLTRPRTASAHCDTMDGPAVTDGRRALETGNVNYALKWIQPDDTAELVSIFDQALAARSGSEPAQQVADRWFLENLVRIHRAGEGASYTGLQPAGTAIDPRVRAADEAVAAGSMEPLTGLVPAEQVDELERRFAVVLERDGYDVDDVDAARSWVEAYVRFFKLAEGHDHGHAHEHEHGHGHTAEVA